MVQPVVTFYRPMSLGSYGELKSEVVQDFSRKVAFLEKNEPLRRNFQNFVPRGSTSCVQISWKLADRKSVKSRVAYVTKTKFRLALSFSLLCRSRQNLPGPAANNVLRVPKISSKSVHFRLNYSRMPQSVSNTRGSFNQLLRQVINATNVNTSKCALAYKLWHDMDKVWRHQMTQRSFCSCQLEQSQCSQACMNHHPS